LLENHDTKHRLKAGYARHLNPNVSRYGGLEALAYMGFFVQEEADAPGAGYRPNVDKFAAGDDPTNGRRTRHGRRTRRPYKWSP
jgi:hypothetical protein